MCMHNFTNHISVLVCVLTWRSAAPVWRRSPLSTSSWFSAGPQYAASLTMPSPGFPPPDACVTQTSHFSKHIRRSYKILKQHMHVCAHQAQLSNQINWCCNLVAVFHNQWQQYTGGCTFDRVWIGHLFEAGHLLTRGRARSVQWQTWWSHNTAHSLWAWSLTKKDRTQTKNFKSKNQFIVNFPAISVFYTEHPKNQRSKEAVPTRPPDAFGRRWDTTIKALVPFSKQPVDHFPFLIHHKSLNLIHIRTPVVSLKDKYHVAFIVKRQISHQNTQQIIVLAVSPWQR